MQQWRPSIAINKQITLKKRKDSCGDFLGSPVVKAQQQQEDSCKKNVEREGSQARPRGSSRVEPWHPTDTSEDKQTITRLAVTSLCGYNFHPSSYCIKWLCFHVVGWSLWGLCCMDWVLSQLFHSPPSPSSEVSLNQWSQFLSEPKPLVINLCMMPNWIYEPKLTELTWEWVGENHYIFLFMNFS